MEKNELPCWAALAIIAVVLLLAVFIWQFPKSSSEWAAWMQAFGSIFAVGAMLLIGRNQLEAESRRQNLKISQSIDSAEEGLIRAISTAGEFYIYAFDFGKIENHLIKARLEPLRLSLKVLETMPNHQYPFNLYLQIKGQWTLKLISMIDEISQFEYSCDLYKSDKTMKYLERIFTEAKRDVEEVKLIKNNFCKN